MRSGEFCGCPIRRIASHWEWPCGILACFTPFFGLHILIALLLAFVLRGNLLAALVGTFFGNPITFPVIAAASYNIGHRLSGTASDLSQLETIRHAFEVAAGDVKRNLLNLLGSEPASWEGVKELGGSILLPYSLGGLICGVAISVVAYFVMKPLVHAYQHRRRLKFLRLRNLRSKMKAKDQPAETVKGD